MSICDNQSYEGPTLPTTHLFNHTIFKFESCFILWQKFMRSTRDRFWEIFNVIKLDKISYKMMPLYNPLQLEVGMAIYGLYTISSICCYLIKHKVLSAISSITSIYNDVNWNILLYKFRYVHSMTLCHVYSIEQSIILAQIAKWASYRVQNYDNYWMTI